MVGICNWLFNERWQLQNVYLALLTSRIFVESSSFGLLGNELYPKHFLISVQPMKNIPYRAAEWLMIDC